MYRLKEIKALHLEMTSQCNARCPMCLRVVLGGPENPHLPLTELSLEDVGKILPITFIKQLKRVILCGNYGDPIVARDTLKVIGYFRTFNPGLYIEIFTNGSARSEIWWKQLAKIVNSCRFGIDGLEDTNQIYRRGTRWATIMQNVKTFIGAGGQARWDYIVFKHNEHQVGEAEKLSKHLGFAKFQIKKTGRFFSNQKSKVKNSQDVLKKDGSYDYSIEMPSKTIFQNDALKKETMLIKRFGSLEKYFDQTPVQCKVAKEKNLYVSAEGLVFPCCWTANQLYPWYFKPGSSQIWKLLSKCPGGIDSINGKKQELINIVEGPFFQDILPGSWTLPSLKAGKLRVCAKTCGSEFDPFAAQFQSSQPAASSKSRPHHF